MKRIITILLIALGLAEIGARLMTRVSPANGMPAIRTRALLPHRPVRATVEKWLANTARATYMVPDAELGWTIGKDGSARADNGSRYEANAQGVRAPKGRVVAAAPPVGKVRIVAVGDSFTHGDEVSNAETWQAYLEELRSDLEVINLGVPGYGTDQAFLRYQRDGAPLKPTLALLGIFPENISRNLNVSRYYINPTNPFLVKPRFVIEDGHLRLVGTPVAVHGGDVIRLLTEPERAPVLAYDRWYDAADATPRFYHHLRAVNAVLTAASYKRKTDRRNRLYSGEDPSGIEITVAIARAFAADARPAATPLIVLFPMVDFVRQPGFDPQAFPLTKALRATGLDVLDLSEAMQRALGEGRASLSFPSSHYTSSGNRVLAAALEAQLRPWLSRAAARYGAQRAAQEGGGVERD